MSRFETRHPVLQMSRHEDWTPVRSNGQDHMWDAIRRGNLAVVYWFLDNGWDAGRRELGRTAMHVAARYDRPNIGTALIHRGADIEAVDDSNFSTALHIATRYRNASFVRWCLAQNANPIVFDKFGWSPLHYACVLGDLEIIDAMYAVIGPDVSNLRLTRDGSPGPIHIATEYGQFDVLACLAQLDTFEVDLRTSDGLTAFHIGCLKNQVLLCRFLVEDLGADAHAVTRSGCTAAHLLCSQDYKELLSEVVERYGIDIERMDNYERRPIYYAVRGNNANMVEHLRTMGANFEGVLEIAAVGNQIDIVKIAIRAGGASNTFRLRLAILTAIQHSRWSVVFILLQQMQW